MQIIKEFFKKHNITDTNFVVGVSGGADSLALVLLLKEEFPQYNIIALTVNHNLRPSALDEANYVAQIMKNNNIEHHILTWESENPLTGVEEKARNARYDLLLNWCNKNKINNLIIAHHLFDQAETFLMRIQRGSGLNGLCAINEISMRNNINILRPIINTHPDELKKYLINKNITWIEDESNHCLDYLRVKMRKFLPLFEEKTGITALKICETINTLQCSKDFIDSVINDTINSKIKNWDNLAYSFDYNEFHSWHKELQFHILSKLLNSLNNQDYPPEAKSIIDLIENLLTPNFESTTLGECIILKNDLKIWTIIENRKKNLKYANSDWNNFIIINPHLRGIKIPHKLKVAYLNKKN